MSPVVRQFFHPGSSTFSYVVSDPATRVAAVIDPVRDFDLASGRTGTVAADAIAAYVRDAGLTVDWILETHAHADHLSAAPYLQAVLGGRTGIGAGICSVQRTFRDFFNLGADFPVDGSQFDHLFTDDQHFRIGEIDVQVLETPGHTPDGVSYLVGDCVFVGDTLFMPDAGTARCDFPGGDARRLYESIRSLLALPPDTRMFVCHDYPSDGEVPRWQTTVKDQREQNIHVRDGIGMEAFVRTRTGRDATLDVPALLLPAVQVNIRAGEFPEPDGNGVRYLKIPVDGI